MDALSELVPSADQEPQTPEVQPRESND